MPDDDADPGRGHRGGGGRRAGRRRAADASPRRPAGSGFGDAVRVGVAVAGPAGGREGSGVPHPHRRQPRRHAGRDARLLPRHVRDRHAVDAADRELHVPQHPHGAVLRLPDRRPRHDVHEGDVRRRARCAIRGSSPRARCWRAWPPPARSSPTQRGKLVRGRFLCQPIPPPPPGVDTNLPPPAANQSTRALYEAHVDYAEHEPQLPQLPRPHGPDRLRLRALRRRRQVPDDGQRADRRRERRRRLAAEWARKDLQRRRRAGRVAGRERRRQALPGAATGRTTRTATPPGSRTPARTTPCRPRRRRTASRSRACSPGSSTRLTSPAAREISRDDEDAQAHPQIA